MDVAAANEQARQLRRDVGARKRAIAKNRNEMHGLMAEFDRLRKECDRLGIRLEINTQPDQGGQSGSINGGEAETI